MLDFTKPKNARNLISTLNTIGTVRSGADKTIEPLEIEAIHTKYRNKPLVIIIEPSDLSINNDINIGSSPGSIQQYGRMDPLQNYASTSRSMNISFKMIKSEVYNGKEAVTNNTLTANLLQQIIYPSYIKTGTQNTAVIKTPPYFRIKYGDLIGNFTKGKNMGLTGYITRLNVSAGAGYYGGSSLAANIGIGLSGTKIPIQYEVDITFNVMHEHVVGWYDGEFADDGRVNFPFNSGVTGLERSGITGGESPQGTTLVPGSPDAVTGKAAQENKAAIKSQ